MSDDADAPGNAPAGTFWRMGGFERDRPLEPGELEACARAWRWSGWEITPTEGGGLRWLDRGGKTLAGSTLISSIRACASVARAACWPR